MKENFQNPNRICHIDFLIYIFQYEKTEIKA